MQPSPVFFRSYDSSTTSGFRDNSDLSYYEGRYPSQIVQPVSPGMDQDDAVDASPSQVELLARNPLRRQYIKPWGQRDREKDEVMQPR